MERAAHAAHPHAARGPGARRGALRIRNLHPRRRLAALGALAALLLGAALAAPAWAQDIVHPRVLMDTQITVGGYRVEHTTDVDEWGYAAGPAIGGTDVAETLHDGSLGDAAFVHRGVEYTVKRLTISSNASFGIAIEDADAAALPATAAVGIELQGSPTGETVLFDWRQRAEDDVDDEVKTLLTAWRNAPGTVLPVRILNLDASDVWSADLHYGSVTSMTIGYGAPATGTLTATGFFLDGVEYTVDRLTVVSTTETEAVVRFATTPDLPATARLRLAVPWSEDDRNLYRYLALEPASRPSGGTDVDYEWPWPVNAGPASFVDDTGTFYLTRGPGRTGDVSGFWEATLTPNTHTSTLVGYRRPAVTIPEFTHEAAGAGTLTPGTMSLRGVEYTVDALAVVSVTGSGWNVGLRTDPLLPRGQDLWLELGHVDGSTAVFAIDTASVEAPGYLWRLVYAGDRHGWGTDSADAGTDIDSVTVRLSLGAPTITGTAQVDQTLTAVTTGITDADGLTSATYTYQWIRVNGTAADIAGENSSTYTLVDADLGKAIKVKVSFTDDASNAETRTSAATATVTATNTAPTVANEIPDQTATVGTVFDYTFPANTFNDADADTLTYTATQSDDSALPSWLTFDAPSARFSGLPLAADVETVSVKVTASDGNGGSVSDTFDIVVSTGTTTATCTGMCLVSNVGQTGVSEIHGLAQDDLAQSFTTGTNATGYTLTSIELRLSAFGTLTTPTVKLYSGSANGTEESTFTGPATLETGLANYTFTPSSTVNLLTSTTYWVVAEGSVAWTHVVSTSEDATPATGWGIADNRESRSASSTGGFTAAASGTPLQIRVNGTLGSTTTTNAAPTVANAIQDQTATVGTALSYEFPANTFNDADSDTLTYTATKSDDSALPSWLGFDAATRTFSGTPQTADLGTVSVKVTASDGNGGSVSDTFDIVVSAAANNAAMGAPTITGTAQVGETLTAVTTGITDADGLTSVTYTYQWIRANGTEADIASANSSTYMLVAADLGKTIKVKVSFTDDASNDETLTSAATATVTAAPTAPMVSTVVVTSMPASDDTYGTGEMIKFTVTFDQAVTVVGTPEFEFCLGSSATVSCTVGMPPPALRSAALLSGSGTTALVFSYTVLVGDVDDNGIYAGNQNDTIKLDGGDTIQGTVGGLTAVLTHTAVGTPTGHKVNGAAANTAPTAANNTVTTGVGMAYAFTADHFGFADTDAGATLASVKIVTLPTPGTLALDGTAVIVDQVVTKADIDDDKLTFTPVAGASGTGYASFTFKVNDGTDDSASAYTMTIDVTASPTVSIAAPTGATDGFLYEFEAATDQSRYRWLLTRAGLTDAELIVNVSVAETGGGDFAADGPDTVMFGVNKSAVSYTPITEDDVDEDHGTVTVTVAAGTGYAPGTASFASVAVRDDDGPLLEVSIDAAIRVPEGMAAEFGAKAENSDGTLTEARHLARLFSGLTEVAVNAQSADGTATVADSDYTAFDGPVALDTFEAVPGTPGGGRWTGKVSVQTTEDMVTENSQDFTVTLSLPAGTDARIALKSGDEAGTATITEGPSVTLTLSDDELDEGDTETVTATVDPVHDMPFTVTLAAESNADRIAFPAGATFTFAASAASASATLTVEAVDNDVDDGDVTIELTATPSDAAVTAPAVELTVVDDDDPRVSIAAPTGATDDFLYEFEAATDELQYQWVLTREGLTDETLTVNLSVSETDGDFVDAAKESATQTVTFAADEMTVGYTPITAEDTTNDAHGTVTVTVQSVADSYDAVSGSGAAATVAVRDDDGELVTVTLDLDPATLKVKEGREAQLYAEAETEEGTFDDAADMARLFGTVTQAEAIASTEASTGTGAATAGTDYTALAAETVALPFADFEPGSGGVLRLRVALPAIATAEDEVDDPDETFEVKLAAPADQDARIAVSTTAATVTINEGPPDGAIRLCSGTAASTCTDADKALASRNSEGRVEVIYNDEWGTVCDDYWSNGDGNVACTQMGYPGAERVFWSSHFGGAARGTKMWLDNLQCVGDEDDLLECRRRGSPAVGEHNCSDRRHTEDAGVRCLKAESELHGAKVDPLTLTIAPGRTGRYWVSLTKDPEADVVVYPKLDTEAEAALEVTEGPLPFPRAQWNYALDVDVTVQAGATLGTYTVTHTMDLHNNAVVEDSDVTELTFAVPPVMVTVVASTSVSGPAPVSATVSGRGVGALRCAAGRVVRAVGCRLRGARGRPPAGGDGRLDGGPFAAAGTGRAGDGRGAAGVRAVGGGAARRPGRVARLAVRDAGASGAR